MFVKGDYCCNDTRVCQVNATWSGNTPNCTFLIACSAIITLCAHYADDKFMIFFLFSQKLSLGISCNLTNLLVISNLIFMEKYEKKKNIFKNICCMQLCICLYMCFYEILFHILLILDVQMPFIKD